MSLNVNKAYNEFFQKLIHLKKKYADLKIVRIKNAKMQVVHGSIGK